MDPDAYLVTITGTGAPASPMPLASAGLRLAHSQDGLSVWVSGGPAPLHVTLIAPSTVLIGEVYASRSHSDGVADPFDAASLAGLGVVAMAERLIDQAWGRFVLVGHRPQAAAFRDPSGALDCVTWRTGPHRFFSGRLPRDLDPLLPAAISIDWSVVADQLCDPLAVSGASGLRNLVAIAPGSLWISTTVGPGEAKQLWRPAELAHRVQDAAGDPRRALHDSVQTCVATLAQPYCRRLVEISGGLDSAIVAAALHGEPVGREVPTRWINYVPLEAEGDERLYARAVAAKHGFELTERLRAPLRYDEAGLAEVGADFRIGLTALDPDYDADLEAEALAFDAEVVITGQGGDAVFLQMATGDALADRLRLQGQIDLAELLAHSRRWRRSLWRTLGDTVRRTVWSAPHRRQLRPFLAGAQGHKPLAHPWVDGLAKLPPAKAIQIQSLLASQNVFGPSRRSRAVRCLHPLLSQPVVELVLAVPSFELTHGGEDRALARAAFASSLPQIIRDRRSKGSMQAFYGRAVAASLDVLRPWLLEGVLQREGLIRTDKLEPLLNADVLIMTDVYVDLLHVAAVEAWARGWSDRIAAIKGRTVAPPVLSSGRES